MKMECLYAPYKFQENETWFNECANQGLHIEKWGATHVDFLENLSLNYQYRIDPDNGGARPNGWREKEMESLGYKYVTSAPAGGFHVYRAPKGSAEPTFNKKLRRQAGILYNFMDFLSNMLYLLIFVFYLAMNIHELLYMDALASWGVMKFSISTGMCVVIIAFCLWGIIGKVRLVMDLTKPVTHECVVLNEPRIKYGTVERVSKIVFIVGTLVLMFFLLYSK